MTILTQANRRTEMVIAANRIYDQVEHLIYRTIINLGYDIDSPPLRIDRWESRNEGDMGVFIRVMSRTNIAYIRSLAVNLSARLIDVRVAVYDQYRHDGCKAKNGKVWGIK